MQSRTLALTFLALVFGACSSAGGEDAVADAKLAARAQLESAMREQQAPDTAVASPIVDLPASGKTTPVADVCKERAWYGDGECDAWCPEGDAKDCAPSAGAVACAEFYSPADGFCNHKDPCGPVQDEDCATKVDPGVSSCAPDYPTAHAGDGKCAPQSLAELKSDPDCAMLVCPLIFSPADGVCKAQSACDFLIDEDCSRAAGSGGTDPNPGVVCDAIAYAANGKCEAPPGCEANDPKDCKVPVACIDVLYSKNGKCEAAMGCESSDPDC
jgi:hypothetical protein